MKLKACQQIGIDYQGFYLPETATEAEVIEKISQLDNDDRVSGILV
jgi:5,10-methylene-tetrahydrofolate dehydrogenase/methenyl tetrahydrofolate cyclohydrolase